ncbi:sulfotransferase family protein [Rhodobacterales bacterium HKCCE3408]|nr:sulfotransferase family protein [Rhodobacterales bacterium HKCCE3408]
MAPAIIGTGFGRTGTDSMREALEILGFGPCHHMRSLLDDEAHKAAWRRMKVARDRGKPGPDWSELLGGFGACVDWPSAAYWPELIEVYPDAKVLLTWRSPESWWESFEKTILPFVRQGAEDPDPEPGSDLLSSWVFNAGLDRESCIAAYEANVAKVLSTVPEDRLLVHKIGDGWEPLCAFLGVPIPDRPYPRTNSAASFAEEVSRREAGSASGS